MIAAGKRTRRVSFERATATTDDHGGEISTWAPIADAFVEVLFGSGQERREAAQERNEQAITLIALWTPTLAGLTVKDRVAFNGEAWDVTNIAPVGLNKELHFTAVRSG